ncbi:MAG: ABC-2 transporter permease [Clostridia bacterium]|nr:ABC-2 transporter permease [Clostridia bacterium]
MKALLGKEFKLCVHPALFIYLALILMLLIPNYPYLVSCFFVCNGIFFCFQQARENGDAMYTAMLPVSKAQTVKARVWFVVIIEMIDLMLMAALCAFAIVSMPPVNAGGTDHSLSLIAFALVVFAIFNSIYLPSFYKTGYKAGTAFLKSAIGIWIWLMLCEGMMIASHSVMESGVDVAFFRFLHENVDCMPKTAQAWTVQLILFGAGLLIYAVCTLLACRISIKRYEKVSVA